NVSVIVHLPRSCSSGGPGRLAFERSTRVHSAKVRCDRRHLRGYERHGLLNRPRPLPPRAAPRAGPETQPARRPRTKDCARPVCTQRGGSQFALALRERFPVGATGAISKTFRHFIL